MIYDYAFSPAVIESEPPPVVPKHLLPWLLKDRREAEEGLTRTVINKDGKMETSHDRMGREFAAKELRRIERDLSTATGDRAAILGVQLTQQRVAVQFWEGKTRLLDRVISSTQANP